MEKILLEAGTNEMELLVFVVDGSKFGINVAKIREIIRGVRITKVPLSHEAVDGSFQLRDEVLTLVNLAKFLGVNEKKVDNDHRLVIVLELNDMRVGISVDDVERIYRRKWSEIEAPPQIIIDSGTPVTGVTHIEEDIILIIDFETIMMELLGKKPAEDDEAETVPRTSKDIDPSSVRLLLADDSLMIRAGVKKLLTENGFTDIEVASDGSKAWDYIAASMQEGARPFDVVLSDIEMPGMDGLHLSARIREEAALEGTMIILFSSIVNPKNDNKGNSVGADAQIAKNNDHQIVQTIRDLVAKRAQKAGVA